MPASRAPPLHMQGTGRLDISKNRLSSLEGVGALASALRWLNASGNDLEDVSDLKHLDGLQVGETPSACPLRGEPCAYELHDARRC